MWSGEKRVTAKKLITALEEATANAGWIIRVVPEVRSRRELARACEYGIEHESRAVWAGTLQVSHDSWPICQQKSVMLTSPVQV